MCASTTSASSGRSRDARPPALALSASWPVAPRSILLCAAISAWLLVALVGCRADVGDLDVVLVFTAAEDAQPLDFASGRVTRLRVRLTGDDLDERAAEFAPETDRVAALTDIPVGAGRILTVEGLDAAGQPYSRGVSLPFKTTSGTQRLFLYIGVLGRSGAFSGPPAVSDGLYPDWRNLYRTSMRTVCPTGDTTCLLSGAGRVFHLSQTLPDGRVLLGGGRVAAESLDPMARVSRLGSRTLERFDPSAGAFLLDDIRLDCDPGDRMCLRQPRAFCAVAALSSGGTWLITGGEPPGEIPVEIFDVGELTSHPGPEARFRTRHGAQALAGGGILVAGGLDPAGTVLSDAELYDERRGSFGAAPFSLSAPRAGATWVNTAEGLIVIGGWEAWESWPQNGVPQRRASARVDRLRLAGGVWQTSSFSLQHARAEHSATLLLADNPGEVRILVCGGLRDAVSVEDTCEILDVPLESSSVIPGLQFQRFGHTATTLLDGRVLLAGGFGGGAQPVAFNTALLLTPRGAFPREMIPMLARRAGHSATLLANGNVLVAGGTGDPWVVGGQEIRLTPEVPYEIFVPR